jgi:hypothetical protein
MLDDTPLPEDGWALPRITWLNKLIKRALDGKFPEADELKGIAGLEVYISKKLPNFDRVQEKLNELYTITGSAPMSDSDDEARAKRILESEPVFEAKYYDNRPHRKPIFEEQYQTRSGPEKVIANKEDVYEFFKSYGTITVSGKFKVLHELDNGEIEFMDKKSFIDKFQPYRIDITSSADEKTKEVPFTELWLNWLGQRSYDGIIFDPSRPYHYDRMYNLFNGFKIVAREGDCAKFLDYMRDIICSGNERNYKYLLALVSQMFQKPGDKPGVAVALRGDEGVGKSFFIEKLGYLMGPYYFKTSNPAYVFGDHNSQLKNKLFMHLEEAVFAGSKKEDSQMKDLITSPTLQIDEKFVPLYSVTNHLHFFLSGNPDHLVRAGFESRRILALHVSDARRVDTDYFSGIDEWFKSGGAENLMHFFLHHKWEAALVEIDIKDLRNVPVTEELIFQRKQTSSGIERWALNCCEEGSWPYGDVKEDGTVHVIKTLLVHAYNNSPEGKRNQLSENEFGNRFLSLFPQVVNGEIPKHKNRKPVSIITGGRDYKIKDCNGRPQYAYIIPASDECRSAIDFKLSGKSDVKNDWDNSEKWSTSAGNDSKDIEDIYDYHRKF